MHFTRRSLGAASSELTWEEVVSYARMEEESGTGVATVAAPPPPVAKPLAGARYRQSGRPRRGDGMHYGGAGSSGDAGRGRESARN